PTAAAALLAGRVDHPPGAVAARAGLGSDELAEDTPGDLLQPPASGAGVALDRGRPRLGAAAAADLARHGDLERHLLGDSGCRIHELDPDLGSDVGSSPSPAGAHTEEVVAEEGREDVAQTPEVEARCEAAAPQPFVAEAVVDLASLGVGEH